jgi:3-hydroxyisobutyrate dehydrogenase-like beta-hydroxyacid dehydrogenase
MAATPTIPTHNVAGCYTTTTLGTTMMAQTIGILSPGEMGAAVGAVLHASDLEVLTWIEERSTTTRQRAEAAGISTVPTLASLVERCDLVLSILAPAHARALAQTIGNAARTSGNTTTLADCNAIAPRTVKMIEADLGGSGVTFLDAGIIGGPPRTDYAPRFYVSGPSAPLLEALDGRGIEVINVGSVTGRASAVKMCYAAMTKGTTALRTALLVAAQRLDVYDDLVAEFAYSQGDALAAAEHDTQRLSNVAARWVGEMEEIAQTFDSVGVTPDFHTGSAWTFREVATADIKTQNPKLPLADAIEQIANLETGR